MAFNIPTQVSSYKYRPVTTVPWTRQPDWPTVTDVAGEVQFLVSDLSMGKYSLSTTFTQTGGVGNIYIAWGDGTTTTISTTTATTSNKTYTIGSGTACSLGYTTFKIRIYGDAGTRITNVTFLPPFSGKAAATTYGLLEAYFGNTTITTMANLFGGSTSGASMLQYVKMPETLGAIDFESAFYNCTSLAKIDMPTSMSTTGMRSAFRNCYSLQSITFPANAVLGDCFNAFNLCASLQTVTLPASVTSITSLNGTFNSCYSLGRIIFPTGLDSCTSLANAFNTCRNLISVEIPGFYTGVGTNALPCDSMFSGCRSLQYIKLPASTRSGLVFGMGSAFASCPSLLAVDLSGLSDISSLASTFSSCTGLSTVVLPTSCPSLTTMSNTFFTCSIQEITLPTTVASGIIMSSAFQNCQSLSSITIPSGWTLGAMDLCFQTCNALITATLPNNTQNSITSLSATFQNCQSLISVVMPTSMTGLTTLATAFSGCITLRSVTLPSTLNSVTTMANTFNGCNVLNTVTLPTSMTALATLSSTFINCWAITSITLPTTISTAATSWANAFQNCYALKTVTLPTSTQNSLTTLTNLFSLCQSLSTINNLSSLTGTSNKDATTGFIGTDSLTSVTFNASFSKLDMYGIVASPTGLTTLRLLGANASQYGGASPQINISYTSLGTSALNQVFTDLPTVTAKTINITGCPGAATCTRSIATTKGWTVTG